MNADTFATVDLLIKTITDLLMITFDEYYK